MGNKSTEYCKTSLCPTRDIPTRDISVGESKQVLRGLLSSLELHELRA